MENKITNEMLHKQFEEAMKQEPSEEVKKIFNGSRKEIIHNLVEEIWKTK